MAYSRQGPFGFIDKPEDRGATPPTFRVGFDVRCDFTSVGYKDLTVPTRTGIAKVYRDEIKPFLKKHLDDVWGAGSSGAVVTPGAIEPYVILNEGVPTLTDSNTLSISWDVQSTTQTGIAGLVKFRYMLETVRDTRRTFVKRGSGIEHDYDEYSPGEMLMAKQTAEGSIVTPDVAGLNMNGIVPPLAGNWRQKGAEVIGKTPYQLYTPEGKAVSLVDFTLQREFIFRSTASAGGVVTQGDGQRGGGAVFIGL